MEFLNKALSTFLPWRSCRLGGLLFFLFSSLPLQAQEAPGADALKEKTIYVPYEKLAEVFEKEGRGIFLPYKEFLELWQRAQPKPPLLPDEPPPAEAVISGGHYQGKVEGEVAHLEVVYLVSALKKKGWSALDLPLKNVAVESARIAAEPAAAPPPSSQKSLGAATGGREISAAASGSGGGGGEIGPPAPSGAAAPPLFSAKGEGYAVYLPAPGNYRVELKLAVRVEARPGRRSLTFGIPPAAISRLDLVIPEENAQLEVKPLMAATQVAVEGGMTRVLAFVGNASDVTVAWSPPAGKVLKEAALLLANQKIKAYLGERVFTISTALELQILRQEIDRVRVRLPQEMRVFSVNGENIREWNVEKDMIEIKLHSAVSDSYKCSLRFERILAETPKILEVPFPQVEGALRESGFIALGHDQGLQVRVTGTEGLSQVNMAELPQELVEGAFAGFRYLAHPLRLSVSIEPILPVVHAESVSVAIFGVEEDLWIGWIDYRIARAGLFTLSFQVPRRWRIASIGDEGPNNPVEDYQKTPVAGNQEIDAISVTLKSRAFDAFRLPFRLSAPGSASPGERTVAAPRALNVQSDRGLLGIGGPRAFTITTLERTNAIPADAQQLLSSGVRSRIPQDVDADLAFTFSEHPAAVRVSLTARQTEIKVTSRLLANVTDAAVEVSQDLEYLIQYAALDRIAFSAPGALDERLKVEARGFKELKKTPAGEGRTRWDIFLQSKMLGVVTVNLRFEEALSGQEGLAVGQTKTIILPLLRAEGAEVKSEEGAVAVRKEGSLEIQPEVKGLEKMDLQNLPAELNRGKIAAAYKFTQASYQLALKLTRHDYLSLADAVVSLISVKSHLSGERLLDSIAVLYVQNAGRQYLDVRLPEGAGTPLSTLVNGQKVSTFKAAPEKGAAGAGGTAGAGDGGGAHEAIRIPLEGAGLAGAIFPVLIEYRLPLGGAMGSWGSFSLSTPEVLGGVPVSKVEVELWLPEGFVYFLPGGTLQIRQARGYDPWRELKRRFGLELQARPAGAVAAPAPAPPMPAGGTINPRALEEGKRLLFQTHLPLGTLTSVFVKSRLFTALDFGLFAAALAAGLWAARRRRAERWWILAAGGAVALLLAWLLSSELGRLFDSIFFAALLLAIGIALLEGWRKARGAWKLWRAERVTLASDPFLEEAQRAPAAPPAVPSSDEKPEKPPAAEAKKD